MTVIDEPAAAIAAGRCLTARSLARKPGDVWTVSHPRTCGWCDYPPDVLRRLIEGFNAWAGWAERSRSYERHDARVWAESARRDPDAAERQIVAAQGFQPTEPVDGPVAHDPEAPPPAPPVDEELAAWT